ncbi:MULTISPECIES: lipid-binding SYLF domain-containing protein [unclassified Undibacterium]|uniref:lipid-binding SYLF domain-containing protein n=1 Tax=unclassified Undibacterium TaxID=2630295 RepID=UPI002AC8D42A|nr:MULTISPECIES: lipid-binding SYLF domain-containing protein [unclassified Undibacterium]MEB0138513.1 lipid-binding SYLF domain-containing protein [Undibacterium sp. CCC2.1]MEB0173086.1 lipid-binding SYLF domain-containing protein [Undibacterium sp. CCC1.1]MEB0176138.1 lipid-binding SYLF domain-containing protein [Undibacterium sp. CCC3.4]MEB0215404.1 lipid-binding SYLF domain-containing protein [Undibacterium sp. 5I2]WPX42745.1 lipid-binding SYLF domain-containing protein [Undibacterium sp. 
MNNNLRRIYKSASLIFFSIFLAGVMQQASAATGVDLDREAKESLQLLYKSNPTAETLSKKARAILVFPKIIKAGLVLGGSYGEGVLIKSGHANEYFNATSASWGWQAGAQSYGYVVFLMSEKVEQSLRATHGWEVGVGPSMVLMNEGVAKNLSTSSLQDDSYAYIFDQSGLMASISIEGTKITPIKR